MTDAPPATRITEHSRRVSASSFARCSLLFPTAPITVRSAPRITWGWYPHSRTRSITCWISSSLASEDILMIMVLLATHHRRLASYTPYFVGSLYAVNITFETPLSGMSMNPARTFGPAAYGGYWHALWIYFVAPTLGMLAAAEVFLWARRGAPPYCAKLNHDSQKRCIFRHGS